MKTIYSFLVASLLLVTSCNDKSEPSPVVSNEEAADMVASSVASSSGGFSVAIEDATVTTNANGSARTQACGYTDSYTQTKVNTTGANTTYSFTYQYAYALTCGAGVPQKMSATATYDGSLDGPRISTQASGALVFDITSLEESSATYLINGEFERDGTFTSKVREKNTSASTIKISLTGVEVNKNTKMITAGTGTITITGSVSGKGDFSFTGSITFKGNKQADVEINGSKYSINIESGDVTAA